MRQSEDTFRNPCPIFLVPKKFVKICKTSLTQTGKLKKLSKERFYTSPVHIPAATHNVQYKKRPTPNRGYYS